MRIMAGRILLSLLTTVALFATCLEGRYHLEATGLRHHRHDRHERHHQLWDQDQDQDPVPRGPRRREWAETDEEETAIDRPRKERPAISSARRFQDRNFPLGHDRWASGHRGRFETQKRGRARSEGRNSRRDYYRGNSWRRRSEEVAKGRRDEAERPWAHRNPSRFPSRHRDDDLDDRRREWYDDDDDGYEADDEEYYAPRKPSKPHDPRSKSRRNWRDEYDDEDDEEDEDYDQDYEDYDLPDSGKRPYRRRHGKRIDDLDEDVGFEKRREGHSVQNEVPGRRGGKKRDNRLLGAKEAREKPEDLNEVEEDVDDDVWADADLDDDDDDDGGIDDYDDVGGNDSDFAGSKAESSLKAIDELIRRLTAGDTTTTTTTTSKPIPQRREYRNIGADKVQRLTTRDRYVYDPKTTPATISTTQSYAKYTDELKNLANSSRNEVAGITANVAKTTGVNGTRNDLDKPLVTQITKTDTDAKTKSLEQDYEEYENDGSEDKPEDVDDDAEAGNGKKFPSGKDQDYNDHEENSEENDADVERRPSSTTSSVSSTTTMRTTTTSTTVSPPIGTRAFDRYPKVMNPRTRPSILKKVQTTSTAYPPMSDYSAHKWRAYGSRNAVNERRNAAKELNSAEIEYRNVVRHAQQMRRETACRWPKPKVIAVRDVYPSPSKSYNPSCTILHRCADDTGCCSPEHTCVPKHVLSVELSFYATGIDGNRFIEKLKFDNHTECQCRPRAPPPPPPPPPTTTMRPCKCPSLFTPKHTPERGCQCVCQDNQLRCLRQRRGKDYFTPNDQWCIKSEQCTIPPCDFGEYMRMPGRCPLKAERTDKVNYYGNANVRHRI